MIDKVFNKYKTNTRAVQSFWALAQVGAEREREREREREFVVGKNSGV